MVDVAMASAGSCGPVTRPFSTSSTESAWCTTRSSRCSATIDGDADVVHQPVQDRQDLFCGNGIQRRGGFVEHQHSRSRGQGGADGDPLLLPAGELGDGAVAKGGEAQQVEGLLHPTLPRVRVVGARSHACRDDGLHGADHDLGARILTNQPHEGSTIVGVLVPQVHSVDDDAPAELGRRGWLRTEALEQRGLARPGRADHEDQLTLGNREGGVAQGRHPGIRNGHCLEHDHGANPRVEG